MPGLFLQSTSKGFLQLKGGLGKAVTRLESQYQGLISNRLSVCKQNTKSLQAEINRIINQLNVVQRLLSSILNILIKILKFTSFLKKLTIGLLILIKILKFFPLPSRWTIVGMIVKMGDLLSKINFQLKAALLIISGLDLIVRYIASSLKALIEAIILLISQLKSVSDTLIQCSQNDLSILGAGDGIDLNGLGGGDNFELSEAERQALINDRNNRLQLGLDLNSSLNSLNFVLNQLTGQLGNLLNNNNSYKGFSFKIVEEETVDKVIAKRRYAIAVNTNGILTLQGNPSYATDTEVLIDELKLRIDSENLLGYVGSNNINPNISTSNQINTNGNTNIGGNFNNTLNNSSSNPNSDILDNSNILNNPNLGNLENMNSQDLDILNNELNDPNLERDIAEEFGLDNPDDILEESDESEKDIEDLINEDAGEKKLKDKFNKKQKRFVKFLEKKSEQGNSIATTIVERINNKQITVADAKGEWLIYRITKIQLT